jgi:ABC-2 type transport system ATP-binding protein/ribosome-dependent ATPase
VKTLALAENVTCRFGDFVAVDRVSMRVESGEVVGLLGANGAGKTTLIRMLLGLLVPTSGRVELFGETPSRATRRQLGYVPQSLGLYEDMTVAENLEFSAAAFGVSLPPLDAQLRAVRGELVRNLPLGLQRGAAFAQALGHGAQVLVLDEPTSGVDPLHRARLWDRIHEQAEHGEGVLVTTHYMDEAKQCDRLVVMTAGRVAAEGTMADIIDGRLAVEVRAEQWDTAFSALDAAGMVVILVGKVLRVSSATVADVSHQLAKAGIEAAVKEVPATFEEAFVALTLESGVGVSTAASRQPAPIAHSFDAESTGQPREVGRGSLAERVAAEEEPATQPVKRSETMGGDYDLLGDIASKVAAAREAVSTAQSVLPHLENALDAGRAPRPDDLLELAKVGPAFAKAAGALGMDAGRATLADLEAELAARGKSVGLRRALVRLSRAAGPAVVAAELGSLTAEAAQLAAAPSWSPTDGANALTLARLVELADLAVQDDGDDESILSLDTELRQVLGPSAAAVVLAATRGRLVLPTAPGGVSGSAFGQVFSTIP